MTRLPHILLFLTPQAALGATLSVPSKAYPTIQSAIDVASDYDVVEVAPGTYVESIQFLGADVEVRSTDGSGSTTIEAPEGSSYAVSVIYGQSRQAVLEGFTIEGTDARGVYISYSSPTLRDVVFTGLGGSGMSGGGVYIDSGSPHFYDCVFDGNLADYGAHVYVVMGSATAAPTFYDTTFKSGDAAQEGGAIYLESGLTVLHRGVFESNVATNGGGAIYVKGGMFSAAAATDTEFRANSSENLDGGAIYVQGVPPYGGNLDLDGCLFEGNTVDTTRSRSGGAVYLGRDFFAEVVDTRFEANVASRGSAIYAYDSTLMTEWCEFVANPSSYGALGAYSTTWDDVGSTFDGNVATDDGGAVSATYSTLDLLGTTFTGNSAKKAGAIYLYSGGFTLDNATFDGNSCESQGGALHLYAGWSSTVARTTFTGNSSDPYSGGALYAGDLTGPLLVDDCTFDSNTAPGTGGMGAAVQTIRTTVQIDDSDFLSNSSYSGGSALYVNEGAVTISGSTFDGNTTDIGSGGAIYLYNGSSGTVSLSLTASEFTDNQAGWAGGAIFSSGASANAIADSVFHGNYAPADGGALYLSEAWSNTLVRNRFCGNTADRYGGAVHATDFRGGVGQDSWKNLIFHLNSAEDRGGAVYLDDHTYNELVNSTFVANSALSAGYGSALYASGSYTGAGDHRSNIYAWNTGVEAVHAADTTTGTALASVYWYNDLWANTPGDFGGNIDASMVTGQGNLALDPDFGAYVIDTDCDNDWFTLAKASPIRDLGEPEATWYDLDGTPNDPGAYGGPEAWISDGDGDEYPLGEDCDDDDEDINPAATDVPYDGTDQDCDGADLDDVDGDGHAADFMPGGDDCDDGDEDVYPGAPETWYDGEDTSCHGRSDYDQDGDGHLHEDHEGDDCDDEYADAYPGADETWYDGVDTSCHGRSDYDQDGDGHDHEDHEGDDCDDLHADAYPGGTEVWYDGIDQDCAGDDDFDQDGDGHASDVYEGDDCDDEDATRSPSAQEVWNGVDDDCDEVVDPDADSDEIIDSTEEAWGSDPNDADSDGDGISDLDEWGGDPDEPPVDTDGDEYPDVIDEDSDDDGVDDAEEGLGDTDGDGLQDFRDPDDDGDQLPTVEEGVEDSDGDGLANYLDPDSDDDGAWDGAEGTGDVDEDGVPDWLDDGADGADHSPPDWERGFGCATAPHGAGWLALALVALVGRRRRRSFA